MSLVIQPIIKTISERLNQKLTLASLSGILRILEDFESITAEQGRLWKQFMSNPSVETSRTTTKEDLDDLFGPMYEEYYEKRTPKVSTNFAASDTIHKDDTPSSTTIIVAKDEAPHIVSSTTYQRPS
ncbi:hypothetical protein Tco_0973918 [Tanacetum coccineum]|uniref:Uncharacterized protein n=1 Tax=Tanacetum coccineum TaxID=301880 RepID=A0ABQ5EA53_9ASTR